MSTKSPKQRAEEYCNALADKLSCVDDVAVIHRLDTAKWFESAFLAGRADFKQHDLPDAMKLVLKADRERIVGAVLTGGFYIPPGHMEAIVKIVRGES